jgi:ribosomal protein S18 acetylase RimI-like enzyme
MPLRPDQALHNVLFPIVYEEEFFRKATLGLDGISSFVALAEEQLVGFVTFRTCSVSECEDKVRAARAKRQKCESNRSRPAPPPRRCHQDLLGAGICGLSGAGRSVVAYILTLGVAQQHQRRGIAAALLARVVADCKARRCSEVAPPQPAES